MKIIKNFYVGFCFVQTGTRRRYCLVIRLSKKCYLGVKCQTLIGPVAITTIMLMCIRMHNAQCVCCSEVSHSVRICSVYKIILKS